MTYFNKIGHLGEKMVNGQLTAINGLYGERGKEKRKEKEVTIVSDFYRFF